MTTATSTKQKITKKERGKTFSLKALFNRPQREYAHPYLGGIVLGIVLFLSFFLTGNGLGASGSLSRLAVFIEDLIAPGHINQVPYLISMAGGERNPLDNWIILVTLGTVLGGFISGLVNGRTRFETTKGPNISRETRWAMAFFGGMIFAFGARMARGCTSGQALSGGATLSAGSWAVMLSIFAGAYALAYFLRKFWN